MDTILILDEDCDSRRKLIEIILDMKLNLEYYETSSANDAYVYMLVKDVKAIVMDIEARDYDSSAFARNIRDIKAYCLVPIIVISKNQHRKMEAYEKFQCYSYMKKPIDVEKVRNVFERLFIGFQILKNEKSITLSLKRETINISLSDILYVEYHNRKITLVTEDRDFECNHITMKKMESMLNTSFLRVHQSFIVNKEYIGRIDYASVSIGMGNKNKQIPIGRTYQKAVRKEIKQKIITI